MPTLIKLTDAKGGAFLVNADHISYVLPNAKTGDGSIVELVNSRVSYVRETPQQIADCVNYIPEE